MSRLSFLLLLTLCAVPPVAAASLTKRVVQVAGIPHRYYIAADGKRYVFPPPVGNGSTAYDVFATLYADASEVITISQAELNTYPIGRNVTVRPGSRMIGITTDPKAYVVGHAGTLHLISEAGAQRLYGANWRQERFSYIPDAYFVNYTMGSALDESAYPEGTLIRFPGEIGAWLMDGGRLRLFENSRWMYGMGYRFEDALIVSREEVNYPADYSPPGWIDGIEERLTTPAGPIDLFRRGDINGDGQLNLTDAVVLLEALFRGGQPPACADAADVNDDGDLNISDPIRLLIALFIGDSGLPEPQWLGDDPTADELTCACYRCDTPQVRVSAAPLQNGNVSAGAFQARIGKLLLQPRFPQSPIVSRLSLTVKISLTPGQIHGPTNLALKDREGRILAGPKDPNSAGLGLDGILITRVDFQDAFQIPLNGLELDVLANLSDVWQTGETLTCWLNPSDDIAGTDAAQFGPDRPVRSATLTVVRPSVTLDVAPQADATVTAGALDVDVMRLEVANTGGEPVKVTNLRLRMQTSGEPHSLYGWQLLQGETKLTLIAQPWSPASPDDNALIFLLRDPLTIAVAQTRHLTIQVNTGASYAGTIRGYASADSLTVVSTASGAGADVILADPLGPTITVVPR